METCTHAYISNAKCATQTHMPHRQVVQKYLSYILYTHMFMIQLGVLKNKCTQYKHSATYSICHVDYLHHIHPYLHWHTYHTALVQTCHTHSMHPKYPFAYTQMTRTQAATPQISPSMHREEGSILLSSRQVSVPIWWRKRRMARQWEPWGPVRCCDPHTLLTVSTNSWNIIAGPSTMNTLSSLSAIPFSYKREEASWDPNQETGDKGDL